MDRPTWLDIPDIPDPINKIPLDVEAEQIKYLKERIGKELYGAFERYE